MARTGSIERKQRMRVVPLPGGVLFPGSTVILSDIIGLDEETLCAWRDQVLQVAFIPLPPDANLDAHASGNLKYTHATIATEARLLRLQRTSDGRLLLTIQGLRRVQLTDARDAATNQSAARPTKPGAIHSGTRARKRAPLAYAMPLSDQLYRRTPRFEGMLRKLKQQAIAIAARSSEGMSRLISRDEHLGREHQEQAEDYKQTPLPRMQAHKEELRQALQQAYDPSTLCYLIAPHLLLSFAEHRQLLCETDVPRRVKCTLEFLERELQYLQVADKAQTKRSSSDNKTDERRHQLREHLRLLQQELGDSDSFGDELTELEQELEALTLPEAVREVVDREIDRMELMPPGSSEYMVSYTYISWVKDLPWSLDAAKPLPSLARARRILNKQHAGLVSVKEKILEYLAVMRHKAENRGQVLLLSGPPGVGKTSLARSIAEALGRPFVRIALGGVKDEAEIRGHRRTYIGSMPGKLMHAIRQTKTMAPVILLDEIEKVGLDQGRGALSSALLEVLDYEQNSSFLDHYLGLPYDLSNVLFIATANSLDSIPEPLLDRMELVELSSYTEQEKLAIATNHLLPELCGELGLARARLKLNDKILQKIIREYTREAGVRQLRRELSTIGRKIVKSQVDGKAALRATPETLHKFLGPAKFFAEPNDAELTPGVAVGLAYTSVGGDILYIETSRTLTGHGRPGKLNLTGSLGKVMRESAQTAISYLTSLTQANPAWLGVDAMELLESQIHIHFPDGATPKDGPSAGIAILCAITSLFTQHPLASNLAMTGEVTLRGQVLPVGGIKEKLIAAHRYGKTRVILPAANQRDLEQVPREVLHDLDLILVKTMDEALAQAGLSLAGSTISKAMKNRNRLPKGAPQGINPALH